jgi:hypothetical protein
MASVFSTWPLRPHPRLGLTLAPREWLELYRVLPWGHKVSNVRLLLYPLLAYVVAGPGDGGLRALNLAALLGLLMFQGATNDYWDYRTSGERNRLGVTLEHLCPPARSVRLWLVAPLAAVPPIIGVLGWNQPWHPAIGLLLLGALVALAYSTPPLRLKARRPWGMLAAPCLTTCMFLEALVLEAPLTAAPAAILLLLFLFQLHAEAIHSLANPSAHAEKCTDETARRVALVLPVAYVVVALPLALWKPWFWLSVLCGLIRLAAVRRIPVSRLREQGHATLTSPVLCLYEFAAYALVFAGGLWR